MRPKYGPWKLWDQTNGHWQKWDQQVGNGKRWGQQNWTCEIMGPNKSDTDRYGTTKVGHGNMWD